MTQSVFLEKAKRLAETIAPLQKAEAIMMTPTRQAWRFVFDRGDLLTMARMARLQGLTRSPELLFDPVMFERMTTEHDIMNNTLSILVVQTELKAGEDRGSIF